MVLDRPYRIEPGLVRDPSKVDLLGKHLTVRLLGPGGHGLAALLGLVPIPIRVVLVEDAGPDTHDSPPDC